LDGCGSIAMYRKQSKSRLSKFNRCGAGFL